MKFIDMIKNSSRINYEARVYYGKNEEETTAVSQAEKPHRVEAGEPSTYSINKHLAMYDVKTRKKGLLRPL